MTIIVFLIDTSASMNQRTYLGTSILDVTKGAVETFMKIRCRDPASRGDRYMLLTLDDPPSNIKAGWKESHGTFISKLKHLKATGITTMGPALKNTFDLLNINRMQSGVDTYGQGRCPFYLEPAMIICFTDGSKLTNNIGISSELNLPMTNSIPGVELTTEPFRWDQRLFSVVLNLPSTQPADTVTSTFIPYANNSPIDAMCEVTGGRSYFVSSQKMLVQSLESLVQKCHCGVVINFEKIGPDPSPIANEEENDDASKTSLLVPPESRENDKNRSTTPTPSNTAWHNTRKLIYVPRSAQKGYSVGHWPIPESFWPDVTSPTLIPRSAQPNVKFSCTSSDAMVLENLPFDKYELEPSPLTQFILERKQPNVCWQVFVSNSAKYSDTGYPFGYVKASSNLQTVNLFVMPYNYPLLIPLLDELFKVHKMKPSYKWKQNFETYLKSMPVYYAAPLRRALQRMGVNSLVPETLDNCLSYSVISYLKKLKNQAKVEFDQLCDSVGSQKLQCESIKVTSRSQSIVQRTDFDQLMQHYDGDLSGLKEQLNQFDSFTIAVQDSSIKPQSYRNPFDVPRKQLLDQIARMRANFLQPTLTTTKLQDDDQLHSIPVQQMGNYQEYLKNAPQPLREIDIQPVRLHMFGNPFKVNKNLMIDEADEAMPGEKQTKKRHLELPPSSPRPGKRKGPLPKDFVLKRPDSPSIINNKPVDELPCNALTSETSNTENSITVCEDEIDTNEINVTDTNVISMNNIQNEAVSYVTTTNNLWTKKLEKKEIVRNRLKEAQIQTFNAKLKQMVIRHVRKPGKDHAGIFEQLNTLQGSLDKKKLIVKDIIYEAKRFKRKELMHMLEQLYMSMIKEELRNEHRPLNNNKLLNSR